MEIGSTYPLDPLHQDSGHRPHSADGVIGKPPVEKPVGAGMSGPKAGAMDDVEEKTRRLASLIRERRDSGFYHRADVLCEVVSRLLESNDLVHAGIKLS